MRVPLALVREQAPDVVVMDIEMPGLGGVEATRLIVEESPHTSVVVLTASDDADDVVSAIVAGACGYLLKNAAIDDLVAGIRAAATGDALISPAIAGGLLAHVRGTGAAARSRRRRRRSSRRASSTCCRLVAEGSDNADIARELFISPKTVKNHISNILMKLQMQNRIQAAVYAVRQGHRLTLRRRSARRAGLAAAVVPPRRRRRPSPRPAKLRRALRATRRGRHVGLGRAARRPARLRAKGASRASAGLEREAPDGGRRARRARAGLPLRDAGRRRRPAEPTGAGSSPATSSSSAAATRASAAPTSRRPRATRAGGRRARA